MTVDEWVKQVWTLLNIRAKTLYDYQHFYRRNEYLGKISE
jgi:hypothetical protein